MSVLIIHTRMDRCMNAHLTSGQPGRYTCQSHRATRGADFLQRPWKVWWYFLHRVRLPDPAIRLFHRYAISGSDGLRFLPRSPTPLLEHLDEDQPSYADPLIRCLDLGLLVHRDQFDRAGLICCHRRCFQCHVSHLFLYSARDFD